MALVGLTLVLPGMRSTVGWVIFFSTFLIGCVDYSVLYQSHELSEIVVPQCVHQ